MRFSFVCATLVAGPLSILLLAAPTAAQQPGGPAGPGAVRPQPAMPAAAPAPAASSGSNVVVMDIAYIFKFHQRFKSRMEEIKQGIEQFDAFVRTEQGKFNTEKEKLATFSPGSKEYKDKEESLARTQSELQIKMGLKRKEFLEQEARVYYETYREIEETVTRFAVSQRIDLVLRFNRDEMKPDDRNSVLAGVNRAVIFQSGRDITELILGQLNKGAPTGPMSNQIAPGTQTARPPAGPSAPIIPQPQRPAPGIQR